MSVPTTIQSSGVPFRISTDGGETWKNVVCKQTGTFNGSTSSNQEESDCGPFIGLGSPSWTVDFTGIVNLTPNSPTEISAKDLFDIWQDKTEVKVSWLSGDGSGDNVYREGSAFITSYTENAQIGNLFNFNMTLTGNGSLTTTA